MKHGARCPACHLQMRLEVQRDTVGNIIDECFECPSCGYAEDVTRVSDMLTVRTLAPFDAKAFFETMRRAAE